MRVVELLKAPSLIKQKGGASTSAQTTSCCAQVDWQVFKYTDSNYETDPKVYFRSGSVESKNKQTTKILIFRKTAMIMIAHLPFGIQFEVNKR